jgi:acetyl esterase/lipase
MDLRPARANMSAAILARGFTMKSAWFRVVLGLSGLVLAAGAGWAADAPTFTRTQDVIYGRKFGTALTMDVFAPKENANGAAILWMVSGGWYSDHAWIQPGFVEPYLKRGYTIFAVVHGSQPKFTIPEAVADVKRAVRYIRAHAKDYHIDPNRLGVTGGSAGGHLSLMLGTTGDDGDSRAPDPIDRVSCRVQAVACFFPPTDFLNYGQPGKEALGRGTLKDFRAPFDFHEFDPRTRSFVEVVEPERIRKIGREVSPVYHVNDRSAPALVVHGDADKLVPIQQSELIMERFRQAGVPHRLIVKKGKEHGWDLREDLPALADWFDQYLMKQNKKEAAGDR